MTGGADCCVTRQMFRVPGVGVPRVFVLPLALEWRLVNTVCLPL